MIKKILNVLLLPIKWFAIGLIYIYKRIISPLLPKSCIYYPTCSSYALDAINEFGVLKGGFLASRRIISCRPKNKGGYDPVEINIKGEGKWLI